VAVVAVAVVFIASLVAYHAEHPTNSEFASVGDSLWWGIVTLTTVGYGDIVPKTLTGRWAGVMIMLTGIAVLGTLAGSLSSFFHLNESEQPTNRNGPANASTDEPTLQALSDQVAALSRQLEALAARLPVGGDTSGPDG
jgi:voltage-gated potassium channel